MRCARAGRGRQPAARATRRRSSGPRRIQPSPGRRTGRPAPKPPQHPRILRSVRTSRWRPAGRYRGSGCRATATRPSGASRTASLVGSVGRWPTRKTTNSLATNHSRLCRAITFRVCSGPERAAEAQTRRETRRTGSEFSARPGPSSSIRFAPEASMPIGPEAPAYIRSHTRVAIAMKARACSPSGSSSTIGTPESEVSRMRMSSGISPRNSVPIRAASRRAPPCANT